MAVARLLVESQPMPNPETYTALEQAQQAIAAAAKAEACGVCQNLLNDRAQDLKDTSELLKNVEQVVARRAPLEKAVASSRSMVARVEPTPVPKPTEGSGGPLGLMSGGGLGLRQMFKERPRLSDMIPGKT